ncbi:hypothetical protein AX14_006045 [Amanita brunnescens Koide BX004]|nr:hypothetical protein AX14_006045 [Amanita brunnescens Koide BX004]
MDALDLPRPPPTAADFPELPRATSAPKMTRSEKAMAEKINTLLLSDAKGRTPRGKTPAPAPSEPLATPLAPTPVSHPDIGDKSPAGKPSETIAS